MNNQDLINAYRSKTDREPTMEEKLKYIELQEIVRASLIEINKRLFDLNRRNKPKHLI